MIVMRELERNEKQSVLVRRELLYEVSLYGLESREI